ncbi:MULTISPECIES: NADP-dependent oxidoreductase [Rhizobium]|uniref:NADPH:quinone reductase-like Zn-dependent oxidoreductase n=1 Tax=Rhizobium paranaense TaxID=1650438 RepID=A0A7W8XXH3_9HYPH|nr:NADPH:quinone reductase-like Zn-dependent oxidoreductase [Rhizobium paranaense]
MKSIRIHGFNTPAVINEVSVPSIEADQVLVRVMASALNPLDIGLMAGWAARFFPIEFPYAIGCDFAGVVERVGDAVTTFKPGNAVVAWADPLTGGGLSEYSAVPAKSCVLLPSSLTPIEGAAIPTAGSTAWHGLFSEGHIKPGETVLVHAASGGVGIFAVQFAKKAGARVLATTSGAGIDLVRSLGADEVVDYKKQDFAQVFRDVDLVLDLVGGETQSRSYPVLKRGGRLVSTTSPPDVAVASAHGVSATMMYVKPYASRLDEVVRAVAQDGFKVVLDTSVPFEAFNDAIERQRSGRARGKIIITQS